MIKYNPKVWLSIIFHNYSRHVMKLLMPALIFLAIYSALVCYLVLDVFRLHEQEFHSTIAMHSLLGIVLGLFLVFRTNSAYDRWWEGRKLWGSMVNNTRNLAHKMSAFLDRSDLVNRQWYAAMIPNFVISVKDHLRDDADVKYFTNTADDVVTRLRGFDHLPNGVSALLYERTNQLYRTNVITGDHLFLADKELKEFADILGACERIKNTPIPYSYSMYVKKFIFIYLITLPFGFVTTSGYITIPIVLLIAFVLLSVELIAEEIEDPFGKDVNDLPTDELSAKITENVNEILLR